MRRRSFYEIKKVYQVKRQSTIAKETVSLNATQIGSLIVQGLYEEVEQAYSKDKLSNVFHVGNRTFVLVGNRMSETKISRKPHVLDQ